MYCPSCDKSYGAVHSRCPECHSWLKVSAPANHRSKSASASSASPGTTGVVSTLDKETSWPEPGSAPAPSAWASESNESWSDALPAAAPKKGISVDPAPASTASAGWSGGGGWGEDASASGGSDWSAAKMPTSTPTRPASSGGGWLGGDDAVSPSETERSFVKPSAQIPSEPMAPAGKWLDGQSADSHDDGWGGGSSAALKAESAQSPRGNGIASMDGWGGSSSSPAAPPADDWSSSSSGGGWLGDSSTPSVSAGGSLRADSEGSSAGWLSGGSRETHSESRDGWLSGEDSPRSPSMTEMVDRAIGVEEADDFVDESWVDIDDGDFDPIADPEFSSPTPEVGSVFLKMLLVAALVLLVGGGLMFMGKEEKTPEQIKAEERIKELEFARSSVEAGKNYLKDGKALLAVGPLTAAVTSLKASGAPVEEIFGARAELARALMKSQDYDKAHEQWASLIKAPESYRKEAIAGREEASRLLRAQATADLNEAAKYFQMGESSSVLQAGEKALKIFEKHNGTATQKGKALGMMGRGYLNGKEYGKAREHLHRARSLNPAGGYEAEFQQIAARTAQTDYHAGGNSGGGYVQPVQTAQPAAAPMRASIDSGTNYVRSTGTVVRQGSRQAAAPSSVPAVQQPQQPRNVQQPSAPRRPPSQPRSGGRKGSQGVLPGYDSR